MKRFVLFPKVFTAIFLMLAAIAVSRFVLAQSSDSTKFSVTPAINEIAARPGETTTFKLQVTNQSDEPLPIASALSSFIPNEKPLPLQDRTRFDASLWLTLDRPYFILESGSSTVITTTLTVPEDAEAGGHYATINFASQQQRNQSQANVVAQAEIGALVFITIDGDIDEHVTVNSFNPFPLSIQSTRTFEFSLQNHGNVHALPRNTVLITKGNELVHTQQLQPEVILPGTSKQLTFNWKAESFGRHKVRIASRFGSSSQVAYSTVADIWVLPTLLQSIIFSAAVICSTLLFIKKLLPWIKQKSPKAPKYLLKIKAYAMNIPIIKAIIKQAKKPSSKEKK